MKAYRSLLALFLATTVGVVAQDAPAPAPAATTPPATTPSNPLAPAAGPADTAPALSVTVAAPSSDTLTTVVDANGKASNIMAKADFPNTDIRSIITGVAKLFNLNVVVPDTLTGTTTLQLHDVSWQVIYKIVLDQVGYAYTVDSTSGPTPIILIKNKADVAAEPMETRVIMVNSAKADELAKSLTVFLDTTSKPPETVSPDARTNSLIITVHPGKIGNILEAIDRLDRANPQVYIEAKFVEVNANDDKNLGIDWNFDNTPLVSAGYAYQYSLANGLGAIYASGALPSTNVPEQTISNAVATPTPSTNLNFLQPSTAIASNIQAPARKALDFAVFNQGQYSAVLRALQNITDAKLVSNPTAVTMDNKEVTLYSGTNITVVFPTINNQTGQTQPGSNTTLTVGITMKVLPHVSANGFINLTLNPTLSRIDPQADTYFGASYPRVDTRSLTNADVSIKDGFTIAVGGLIDDQDSKVTTQVPILGDIPIIGNLFKSTDTIHQRNNLIIFVTARTLSTTEGASYRDVVSPEMMLRSGITADEIPGYYNTKRTVDTPGMTYPPKELTDAMGDVQKMRDQAAELQRLQENLDKLKAAQAAMQQEQQISGAVKH